MVARVINLFYREIRGLHQAAYVLALFTLASQILALVRDRILAHQFGAGHELDIYYAAFRIPDLLYVLFASVLSVYVLLPFVYRAKQDGDEAGRLVLSQMFTIFLVVYIVVSITTIVIAPTLVTYFFPGFSATSYDEVVLLLRILLLQPLFLGISSLLGVITQLQHRFVIYAISPLVYNVGIILGAVVLYPLFGLVGLVLGVVFGALGHMAVQIPLVIRSQLAFTLVFNIDWKLMRQIAKVAVPRAVTLSLNQILLIVLVSLASLMSVGSVSVLQFAYNLQSVTLSLNQILLIVLVSLASLMSVGSVSVLQFAYNLQSVPLAIIGMSYSVAAFPTLAELLVQKKHQEFNNFVITALRHIIFWSLPIITLVVVLRAQIVRVLLGSGSFDWHDTRLTAAVLGLFVVSLTAQSVLLLLVRAFYAGGRTRIPFILTLVGTIVGSLSAYGFYFYFQSSSYFRYLIANIFRLNDVSGTEVLTLPLGFTIGVLVQVVLMMFFLTKTFGLSLRLLGKEFIIALFAALSGGIFAYLTLIFVVEGINQETFIGIFIQGLSASIVGIGGIIATYYLLGSTELKEIHRSFKVKLFKTDVVAPQPDVI